MEKIIINGSRPLCGEVTVSGSKNAILPLIFASLLVNGESIFYNVPDIGDVRVAIDIVSNLGAKVNFLNNRLSINTENLVYRDSDPALISKIRASTYLIGASLARFGKAEVGEFGGCNFSLRPIDLHIKSAIALGAEVKENYLIAKKLRGAKIYLEKPSVGATVNTLIMSAAADGETEIYGYAKEPHIFCLIDYLSNAGLSILVTNEKISIKGSTIHPIKYKVIGDMIEAGSYLVASIITDGEITVKGVNPIELSSFLDVLINMGYTPKAEKNSITVNSLKTKKASDNIIITAAPYPMFPTDLQPIMAPMIAKNGGGRIIDTVWDARFGYLRSLSPFGIEYNFLGEGAYIKRSIIRNAITEATDLRGGMSCVISALCARGRSEILSPSLILRGYDSLIEKLSILGADIKLVNI